MGNVHPAQPFHISVSRSNSTEMARSIFILVAVLASPFLVTANVASATPRTPSALVPETSMRPQGPSPAQAVTANASWTPGVFSKPLVQADTAGSSAEGVANA